MRTRLSSFAAAAAAAVMLAAVPAVSAEQQQQQPASSPQQQPQKPASALGKGWTTEVAPSAPAAPPPEAAGLTVEQAELVQRISAYFNRIKHLQGTFVQISPDNETTAGKFYVRRPGRLRFDYAAPSKLRIVADGRYLSIEDHDLKTVDQYPLDATPFGLLLSENVDLLRDASIVDLSQSGDIASLTVEDKGDRTRGRLQLFFTVPEIELKEWVITDPQGLDTRIQLANLVEGEEKKIEFFKSSALDFETFSPN